MSTAHLTVLDFAARLDMVTAAQHIWRVFAAFVQQRGFEYACYMDIPAPGDSVPDAMIQNSVPVAWFERYVQEKYILIDPMALHLPHAQRPFLQDEIVANTQRTEAQRRIVSEGMEFGVSSIFCIPLRSPTNGPAAIGLVGRDRIVPSPADRTALHLASIYTDLRLRPAIPRALALPRLSERERQCLHWVAAGKSDRVIGDILGISEKTVNFHVEAVKRKYQVSSRTLAATMAMKAGVIQL